MRQQLNHADDAAHLNVDSSRAAPVRTDTMPRAPPMQFLGPELQHARTWQGREPLLKRRARGGAASRVVGSFQDTTASHSVVLRIQLSRGCMQLE